ncbi:MAG: hypothetical protein ACUVTW_05335 [Thermogutta sp.]
MRGPFPRDGAVGIPRRCDLMLELFRKGGGLAEEAFSSGDVLGPGTAY